MLGGADNPNGELPSYITGADIIADCSCDFVKAAPTDHRILNHISYLYFKPNGQIHGGKSAGEYPSLIY